LLRYLKIRVIVNGNVIYPLEKGKPIVVPLPTKQSRIVVTDGFHFTKPMEVVYQQFNIYYCKVVYAIDDDQLIIGFMLLALLYAAGLTSDWLLLKIMSLIPVFYFLFIYYINRNAFIQIKPA
jgi:hypothetical protein